MSLLTLLIVQARNEFAPVHGNLLLIRSGLCIYVAIGKVAVFVLRSLAYAHPLNINRADQIPLEAEPTLAVTVIQARHAITSAVGSGRHETRRIFVIIDIILCAVAILGQSGAQQRCCKDK
jgi:hypothetical protein